ncbi:integrase core domain protein [Gregarina niphandrodes]|uniref:Integrase core domain protein n=1 Tax=Gregarina niphandrodes TaxID=110365 RepID=A0A023B4L6_GRENI|nr:integrase core domain protein [Gregarina niphandrodes]EZG56872.1 integrase core domain protein [Gregarina niphandrodes]|eukprot:XP_011131121.1 integrase core domain protein [Gregarina niphandrodes]
MFYWPGLAEGVAKVVRECLICARTRTRARLTDNVPKGSLENPSAMDTVSLDHVGPMQLDGQSWWLLVVMDHATRYMGAWITSTVTAAQTAHIFLRGWVTPFGIPGVVLTDNGTSFRAFHETVASALGCVHLTTATYRPQGNGINEASHKALRSGFCGKKDTATWMRERLQKAMLTDRPLEESGADDLWVVVSMEPVTGRRQGGPNTPTWAHTAWSLPMRKDNRVEKNTGSDRNMRRGGRSRRTRTK